MVIFSFKLIHYFYIRFYMFLLKNQFNDPNLGIVMVLFSFKLTALPTQQAILF